MTVAEQIGQRLRAARLRARLSTEQAARSCRVRKAKLLAWEAGAAAPRVEELGRIARLVGTPPDRLLPPAVLAQWHIDPAEARRHYETAELPEWPEPVRKRRLEVAPAGRPLPLRCDTCGRWFSARPCTHGRLRSA